LNSVKEEWEEENIINNKTQKTNTKAEIISIKTFLKKE
jgi:hypothetical protein